MPANMLGYWNNPGHRRVLIDGWVNTGDLLERRGRQYHIRKILGDDHLWWREHLPDEVDRAAEDVSGPRSRATRFLTKSSARWWARGRIGRLDESAARALKHDCGSFSTG